MESEDSDTFVVKTVVFEGPLDLLLHLIQKRKLHISDVSLAEITDDYISYIEKLESFPTRSAADFILVASSLVLLKSRALLPILELTSEEEADIEDLEERLKFLERIKELSLHIEKKFGASVMLYREMPREREPVFSPSHEVTVAHLKGAIARVVGNLPRKDVIPQVIVQKIIRLEDIIDNLSARVRSALSLSFNEFTGGTKADRVQKVVSLLAVLELVRRGIITVTQNKHFEDIAIESGKVETPKYF